MSHFDGSSSLHIITASASNTKSVKLYRSTDKAEVTHTLPVHLKEGVIVVELRGVSAKIVNTLVMPVACSFQDPDAQPSNQSEHTTRMMSTPVRLIGVQVEGSTIRITIVSDTTYRQDVFVSYYLQGLWWDPYLEFHVTTIASPEGLTLLSNVTIHQCAIFKEHTGVNWDGNQFPIIIVDAHVIPYAVEVFCERPRIALRAPAPGGGLFQLCQLPPINRHASPSRRNEGDGDSIVPLLVTPDALQPHDDAASSLWNRRCADREVVQVAPVMTFPAQYERVLSLNAFTMNRGGPVIMVEGTIDENTGIRPEDVLKYYVDSITSTYVDGKLVDAMSDLYDILFRAHMDGSRTFPLLVDRMVPVEYTIPESNAGDPFNSLETSSHRVSTLSRPDLLHTEDDQLGSPAEHILAIISNKNPFPISVTVLVSRQRPLKSLTCTIYSQPIDCIDPTSGDRIVLPDIPAHAKILLDIEWEAQRCHIVPPPSIGAWFRRDSDGTGSRLEIRD